MRTVEAGGLAIGEGHPPRVMGVVNLSPESPYDPSVFEDPGAAAAHADDMIADGADIVDVGLATANKRMRPLTADEELDRLDDAIDAIASVSGDATFSIETRYADVAAAALDAGFDMVNDVCGFADPEMPRVCEARDAAVVKMASPPDLERPGAIADVDAIYDALAADLTSKTIVDPAFGGWSEAKTLADDRETFRRLREFRALDRPILVSINRKNFLRELAGRSTEAALPVSLAATSLAVERGANVIRTHDVAATRDAAIVGDAFAAEPRRGERVRELDVRTPREADRSLDRLGVDGVDGAAVVWRAYEVVDLGSDERDRVRAAAREHDAGVFEGPDGVVVAGPIAALRRIGESLGDEETLADVASCLAGA